MKPNICLYFDDFRAVGMLPDAERGRLFLAILKFAEHEEEPDFSSAPLLEFAWASIRPKLVADGERYEKNSAQKKYAAYCRDTKKEGREPMTFDEWRSSAMISRDQVISGDVRSSPSSSASSSSASSSASSSDSEAVSSSVMSPAAALLHKFAITGDDELLKTISDDLVRHGQEIVAETLTRAVKEDTFGKITARFYTRILLEVLKNHKKKPPTQDYQTRNYSAADYAAMEVNLDAALDAEE